MAHRRRGVGVGRSVPGSGGGGGYSAAHSKLQKKADEIHASSFQNAIETIEKLQISLQDFAMKHQSDIQHDPAFRQQFLQMCAPLGVDPLQSRKSFWSRTLGVGMGDFYYELSVKVAEVCLATRSRNGGIMAVSEVLQILNDQQSRRRHRRRYNNDAKTSQKNSPTIKAYNAGDIQIAVKKLHTLGGGFRIVKVVDKMDMIVSVPTELDQDHVQILQLAAQDIGNGQPGCVTVDDVTQHLKWTADRANRAVSLLLQEGMAWQDDFHGITFYWFPSIWKETILASAPDGYIN